ncbi:hypothetical protein [Streptomyces sp. G-G2]|uniref:hypothetical protein n=1 Tax=Streptomyces sp. G-G2 TaxID=3046201 RepID=UPI0024BA16E5|nr:hypothetical protein [Streptomyces sp. G-G2]MDJ0382086.1 hypothetical protein [Streptomyces sp. G-G2]
MTHSAHTDHHAVLRARVALLGSGKPTVAQRVEAYRVLARVSPLAYLPLLARTLGKYAIRDYAHEPLIALALLAESVAAGRRMVELEPVRGDLLTGSLAAYRVQLAVMGRQEEARAVEAEIARLVSAAER